MLVSFGGCLCLDCDKRVLLGGRAIVERRIGDGVATTNGCRVDLRTLLVVG